MLTAAEVLQRYRDEELPELVDRPLVDVNEVGRFENRPLHIAAVRGDPEEVAALLAGGADVNAIGEMGNQPIHEAIGQGNVEAVRLLLQAGATLDRVNELGWTPREMAMASDDEALKELVSRHDCAS